MAGRVFEEDLENLTKLPVFGFFVLGLLFFSLVGNYILTCFLVGRSSRIWEPGMEKRER